MRRINPSGFRVATRGTSREINRSIVLNLVRARQPISRADLARAMDVRRGAVTLIVNDLLARRPDFRGRHRRNGSRPQADVSLHRFTPPRRRCRRHPRQRDVRHAGGSARQSDDRRDRLSDRARSEEADRAARRARQGGAGRSPGSGRLRRPRRRGARHGRAFDDARAACADARVAQRQPARGAGGGDSACPCRSKTPAAPARWRRPGRCARTSAAPTATWCSSAFPTASASA